jgi:integrase
MRLRAEFDTPEWWAEYNEAMVGTPKAAATPSVHTLAWAIDKYRHSSAWAALSPATRRQTENIYKHVTKTAGHVPLRSVTAEKLKQGREDRKDRPHAANNFLKSMRRLLKWAADPDGGNLIAANPAQGVKLLAGKNDSDGFHTWSEEEIQKFEAHWQIGTRERLALDLLLYTGLSRGDVVRLGRQHVKNGVIEFHMEKRRGVGVVYPPMLPVLAATIAASKTGDLTYLVTENGTGFVKESFGNWFREACRKAGVPGSAHGLRKAAATRCAENGATVPQLMAMFGWGTEKMALHYTKKASRRKLAADAAVLMLPGRTENANIPHLSPGTGKTQKTAGKTGA